MSASGVLVGAMRSLFLDAQLSFGTPSEAEMSEDILLRALGLVARLNLYYLKKNPRTPKLYASGVRWCPPDQAEETWVPKEVVPEIEKFLRTKGMKEDKVAIIVRLILGAEIFQDIPNLLKSKRGDCDRLVAMRLAELWLVDIMASPYLIAYPNDRGGTTYHAVILHGDGTSEDPSLLCGMPAPLDQYAEEVRKNHERQDDLFQSAADLVMFEGGDTAVLGAMLDAAAYVPPGGFR